MPYFSMLDVRLLVVVPGVDQDVKGGGRARRRQAEILVTQSLGLERGSLASNLPA